MKKATLRFTVLSLSFWIFSLHSSVSAQEKNPEELYKAVLPSVMTLIVEKKDGSISRGTAFLAIKDGLAITAWHVIKDAARSVVRFASGEEFEVSGLVDKDEKRDVAIIRVKVFGKPILSLATTEPEIGSRVYIIGAPKGLDFTITDGLLSQIRVIEGIKQYQFSCPASSGNSGGPLMNNIGEVLGVVSWQVRDGQNLSFAIPSTYTLGLDTSLPTQAWDTIKVTEPLREKKAVVLRPASEVLATAKSLCVLVTQGSPVLKTEISGKLVKWGKLSLVSSPDEADLILYVVQTGRLNTLTGEGNQATVLLKDRESGSELWADTKGGSWSWSGWKVSSVARSIADSFIKFFEKTVKDSDKAKKR